MVSAWAAMPMTPTVAIPEHGDDGSDQVEDGVSQEEVEERAQLPGIVPHMNGVVTEEEELQEDG